MDAKSVPWQIRYIPFLWTLMQLELCFWSLDASSNHGPIWPILFLIEHLLTWALLVLYIKRPLFDSVHIGFRWMQPLTMGWIVFSFGFEHIVRRAFEAIPNSNWTLQHDLTVLIGLVNVIGVVLIWRIITLRTRVNPLPGSVQT